MSTVINGYPLDVAVSVKYTKKSDVTQKPVERGTNVTDSIRPNEPELEIQGVVSDTPIGAVADHVTRTGDTRPAQTAFQIFNDFQGQILTVDCSLGHFEQMAISNFTIDRDVKTRKAMKFTVTLTRIRIEDNNRTTVPSAIPTGLPNFGLSIDKVFGGDKMLWRKGDPPGLAPFTEPKGVIVGTEVVQCRRKGIFHLDGQPLSPEEGDAFIKDLQRDSAIMQHRAFGKAKIANQKAGERIDRMQKILDRKNQQAHPGQHVDPAIFGK